LRLWSGRRGAFLVFFSVEFFSLSRLVGQERKRNQKKGKVSWPLAKYPLGTPKKKHTHTHNTHNCAHQGKHASTHSTIIAF